MILQNETKNNKIRSPIQGVKMGLNIVAQVKDEFRDVQGFFDDCLLTHFPYSCPNNLNNTHERDKWKSPPHAINVIPSSGVQRKKQQFLYKWW